MTCTLLRHQFSIHVPYVSFRCRQASMILRHQLRAASFVPREDLVDNDGSHVSALGDIGAGQKKSCSKARSDSYSSKPAARFAPQQSPPLPDRVEEGLMDLLRSNLSKKSRRDRLSIKRPQDEPTSQDFTDNDLDVLNQMLFEEKGTLKEFLQQCKDTAGTEARKSFADGLETRTGHKRFAGRDIFADILLRVCRSRSRHPMQHHLVPTASEVIRLYQKHNLMNQRWHVILGIQIGALLESVHDPLSAEVTHDISDNTTPILEELLDFWAIFLEEHGTQQRIMGAGTNPLIALDNFEDSISGASISQPWISALGFSEVGDPRTINLSKIYGSHMLNQRVNVIAAAAIVTDRYFQLLVKKNLPVSKSTKSAKSFLQFSEQCSKEIHLDRRVFQALSTYWVEYGTPLHIVDRALKDCGVPQSKVVLKDPVLIKGLAARSDKDIINDRATWDMEQVNSFFQTLSRPISKLNQGLVSEWKSFQTKPIGADVGEWMRDRLFLRLIRNFFYIGRPKLAVEVWNLMVKSDVVPKSRHWQAMIVGSARMKDFASMQACWYQMKAAGIEPVTAHWTAWIYGLITCGEWRRGIEALEGLERLWKKAPTLADSDQDQLLPSFLPVNAAISGVLEVGKPGIAPRIFSWAKLQKLPLHISTFNLMLESAFKNNESKTTVDQLLSEMKAHNCQPDNTTYTIFLDAVIKQPNSSFHTKKPEAQQTIIFTLLTNLQRRGLGLSARTYANVLDGLLAPETANTTIARAVLEHMAANKVQPSRYVYKIFMNYYFNATPPDLPAIDSLWSLIRHDRDIIDSTLLDRMIEGYRDVGDFKRMLHFARMMPKQGITPSWFRLLTILRTLVRARERDLATEFINDVSDREHGLLRHGEAAEKSGRRIFWATVAALRENGWLERKM